MNPFVPYFALSVAFLVSWVIYYRTRQTPESEQDAVALGVVLSCSFVVLSTMVLTLWVCSFTHEG